jgi:hypothetical protein
VADQFAFIHSAIEKEKDQKSAAKAQERGA